jgi:ribosomal protein S13
MILINKVNISSNQRLFYGLKKIYGINSFSSFKICYKLGYNPFILLSELLEEEIQEISFFIDFSFITQMEKKKQEYFFLKKHMDIKNYKALLLKIK